MIPDNVEKIIMTKEDYDRNVEQLLFDKLNAEEETERLHSIIKEVREYIEEMNVWCVEFENFGVESKELLEILDKE